MPKMFLFYGNFLKGNVKEMVKKRLKLRKDEKRAKRKYLIETSTSKFRILSNQDMSIEKYSIEFQNLVLKGDL